jgi:hypothetical protein
MLEILDHADMADYNCCSTPEDLSPKLFGTARDRVVDPTDYRSLVGVLQYLTFTCPNNSCISIGLPPHE